MPVTYTIDAESKVIRTTCSSPLTFAEVVGHFQTLGHDPKCSGHVNVLLNLGDVGELPESGQLGSVTEEMRAIRQKVQFGFCAIVASRDAMFGMMRMFEVFAGPYFRETHVFRGPDEAEAWLAARQASLHAES